MAGKEDNSQKLNKLFKLDFYKKQTQWKLSSSKKTPDEQPDIVASQAQNTENAQYQASADEAEEIAVTGNLPSTSAAQNISSTRGSRDVQGTVRSNNRTHMEALENDYNEGSSFGLSFVDEFNDNVSSALVFEDDDSENLSVTDQYLDQNRETFYDGEFFNYEYENGMAVSDEFQDENLDNARGIAYVSEYENPNEAPIAAVFMKENTENASVPDDNDDNTVTKRLEMLVAHCQENNIASYISDDFSWNSIPIYSQDDNAYLDEFPIQRREVVTNVADSTVPNDNNGIAGDDFNSYEISDFAAHPHEDWLWLYERYRLQFQMMYLNWSAPEASRRQNSSLSSYSSNSVEFMRYAHNAPHSSELSINLHDRSFELDDHQLASLSPRQLAAELNYHADALNRLTRESTLRTMDMMLRVSRVFNNYPPMNDTVLELSVNEEPPAEYDGGRGRGRGRGRAPNN